MSSQHVSRRAFLATAAALPAAWGAKRVPIGLELYSVRDQLQKDTLGTVKAVGKMGYQGVEFYSPYFDWTPDYAKEVRKVLDDLNIRCFSTHNSRKSFLPEAMDRAIELNRIIGSKFIVMASAGRVEGLDGWKRVAEELDRGAEKFKSAGIRAGYHNHASEFKEVEGRKPIEVIAGNTMKDVMLQLDVGTCLEAGADPVAWIRKNPGRINCIHCKDWSPEKGYKVLFGEGAAPWKKIFEAAEKTGGVEYYLIEQEGSDYPSLETAERCLKAIRKLRG